MGIIRIRTAQGNSTARKNIHPSNKMINPASMTSNDTREKNSSAPRTPKASIIRPNASTGRPAQDGSGRIVGSRLRSCQRINKAKRGTKIPCSKFGSRVGPAHCRKRRERIEAYSQTNSRRSVTPCQCGKLSERRRPPDVTIVGAISTELDIVRHKDECVASGYSKAGHSRKTNPVFERLERPRSLECLTGS